MALCFAHKWSIHPETKEPIELPNGVLFRYAHARHALKTCLTKIGGDALKSWINDHDARLVTGPHKSVDKRLHMLVIGITKPGGAKFGLHVYISPAGEGTEMQPWPTFKTGLDGEDWNCPSITHTDDL